MEARTHGRVRAIAAAVCAAAPKEPQERRRWAELGPDVHRYHHPLIPDPDGPGGLDAPQAIAGFSREVPAGSRSLPVVVMVGQRSGPTLLIVAGEHGDEYEGMVAIHSLANTIDLSQLAGTIVAVVCCSMDAYLADDRRSATDGKNMARCYPGDPHGTLTERATQ